MTEEKLILFGIQSVPASADWNVPTAERPVGVQLDGCDIPEDQSLGQPGSSPSCQDATSFRRGFLEGGENDLKKLSTVSVMKLSHQGEESPVESSGLGGEAQGSCCREQLRKEASWSGILALEHEGGGGILPPAGLNSPSFPLGF